MVPVLLNASDIFGEKSSLSEWCQSWFGVEMGSVYELGVEMGVHFLCHMPTLAGKLGIPGARFHVTRIDCVANFPVRWFRLPKGVTFQITSTFNFLYVTMYSYIALMFYLKGSTSPPRNDIYGAKCHAGRREQIRKLNRQIQIIWFLINFQCLPN